MTNFGVTLTAIAESAPSNRAINWARSLRDESARLPTDERLNQATHGLGLFLSVIAAAVLLANVSLEHATRSIGCIIYALTLSGLYLSSTLSHSFVDEKRRAFWRVMDQVAILGLIVGSFMPFAIAHGTTQLEWGLLAAMSLAALGLSVVRIIRWSAGVPVAAMVVVGLLPALGVVRMIEVGGLFGSTLIAIGSLCYLGGLWFLMNDHKRVHYHAIWHLSTIAGSTFHFLFVYFWCIVDAA